MLKRVCRHYGAKGDTHTRDFCECLLTCGSGGLPSSFFFWSNSFLADCFFVSSWGKDVSLLFKRVAYFKWNALLLSSSGNLMFVCFNICDLVLLFLSSIKLTILSWWCNIRCIFQIIWNQYYFFKGFGQVTTSGSRLFTMVFNIFFLVNGCDISLGCGRSNQSSNFHVIWK